MKTANIIKAVAVAGLAATCVWGVAGCTTGNASATSGSVAATVNGQNVSEDDVTKMIEGIRSQMSLTDADTWGQWLADNSMTPESVREEMINSYAQQELVKQGAKEKNVSVESSEIDEIVSPMKEKFDSDDKWIAALEQAGFTEETYRENIENQLLQKKLTESFATDEEPSDEELLQFAQMYASAYDGAKRSSHILFDSADETTAQDVLNRINSGELDFAEAAKEYSKDNAGGTGGTAAKGGDVGWDKLNSLVTEYTDALSGLEKDQVSGLVTSEFGIHIIKCTDVFNAPKAAGEDGTETVTLTSIDQMPSEFIDSIKASLKQQKQSEAVQTWFTEYKDSADIQINPMPEGLPYAVDMSKYKAANPTDNAGNSVTNEDGSVTTTNEDGSTKTTYPDGTWTETSADGTSVKTYNADGTLKSEEGKEGEAANDDAAGGTGDAANQQPGEAA